MLGLVALSLWIERDGHQCELHSVRSPAQKKLIDVVRPMLNRMLSPQRSSRVDRTLVKLDIRGATSDVSWTSQAHHFVVSSVFVVKC